MIITDVVFLNEAESAVSAIVDGKNLTVPCDLSNRHWAKIVEDGIKVEPYISPVATIQQQIDELEAQQTPRLMREAFKGELYATNKLTELDAQITALRAQL